MKFSNVIPSSWFPKLKKNAKQTKKDTGIIINNNTINTPSSQSVYSSSSNASATQNHSPKLLNQPRKSYHFTRDLNQPLPVKNKDFPPVDLPRKSSRRRSIKKNPNLQSKKLVSSSVSASCACRANYRTNSPDFTEHCQTSSSEQDSMLNECHSEQTFTPDRFDDMLSSCKCRIRNDIVIDVETKNEQFHPELAPIITKNRNHTINVQRTMTVNVVKEDLPPTRRISTSCASSGFKLRTNSPRIASRRMNQVGRKSELSRRGVYESFAVVKTSKDPMRDFRDSMVEMIVENNIMESSKDLEELLACYLSLNSDEYHQTIINVFKQIWFDYVPNK